MLKYVETNWKYKKGFEIQKYKLAIDSIDASRTRLEQQAKIKKISLVAFLNKEQRNTLFKISRHLKQNDMDFYQNSNLHVTLFGFGQIERKEYEPIRGKIQDFSKQHRIKKFNIIFNTVRPGTMYSGSSLLGPVQEVSNGTVIAVGDVAQNADFCKYSNNLGLFLLKDKKIKLALGADFRRKFPTVWCTLGYYDRKRKFKIGKDLHDILYKYSNLEGNEFNYDVSKISLVMSRYKNIRYPKLLQKYQL